MKKNKAGNVRVLRTDVPATLLEELKEKTQPYGEGRRLARKARLPYQSIYVMKTTGRGTQADIEKVQKALKAA